MQKKMKDDIAGILLSQEQIERRVAELAAQIQKDYAGKELVMVCVLNGAAVSISICSWSWISRWR